MFEDFSIMYHAPFLISTGSTMSLLPGVARHVAQRTFVSPLLFDEESLALNSRAPGRRVGCGACEWMLRRDHSLCHCEVPSYSDVDKVLAALRQSSAPTKGAADSAPADAVAVAERVCPLCAAIHCEKWRPQACEMDKPLAWRPAAPAALPAPDAAKGRERAAPLRAAGCAAAGLELMSEAECKAAANMGPRYGRRWIGSSRNIKEAPGCVLWDDGNVEFNTFSRAAHGGSKKADLCNVRGTCLCKPAAGAGHAGELQVVGEA